MMRPVIPRRWQKKGKDVHAQATFSPYTQFIAHPGFRLLCWM